MVKGIKIKQLNTIYLVSRKFYLQVDPAPIHEVA